MQYSLKIFFYLKFSDESSNLRQDVNTEESLRKKRKHIFSEVFEFDFNENKEKFAKCKLCKEENNKERKIKMKDGNTSGIMRHFKNSHKAEYNKEFGGISERQTAMVILIRKFAQKQFYLFF